MLALHIFFTSAILIIGILQLGIDGATLKFYHGSLNNYTEAQLEDPLKLLPYFNKSLVSMFYVFGFTETADAESVVLVLSAYLKKNYTNVILLDWSEEAKKELVGVVLSYGFKAVPLARYVGKQFGRALLRYMENGVVEDKIHLVGHSLGAHVAGFAGEEITNRDRKVARITGLDPAGPLFQGLINNNGLNPSRAKFVDVLHTDPISYGVDNSIGTVDFWANCNLKIQPGCNDAVCSHQRSCTLFHEAILNPKSFPAAQANNCSVWGQDNSANIIYLGDSVDTSAQGNFYFSTNSEYPFSKGQEGIKPNN